MLGFLMAILVSINTFAFSPAVSPDGKRVVFSYMGDLWEVSVSDSIAHRLTDSKGYDTAPIFSPDGSKIVFASNRYGSYDLFVMPSDGSENPRRLTYHPGYEYPQFIKDNYLYFSSWRTEFRGAIYRIPLTGGTPERVYNFFMNRIIPGPGDSLIFERGFTHSWRRKYRGPANRDIWIMTKDAKFMKRLTHFDGRDAFPMYSSGKIYFVSNRENSGNLFVMNTDGSHVKQLTHFKNEVLDPRISEDGCTIVFTVLGQLYLYHVDSGRLDTLRFKAPMDKKFSDPYYKELTKNAAEIKVSPSGKELAFVVFGDIYVMDTKTHSVKRITYTPEPEKDLSWNPVREEIAFTTLKDGNWNIYKVDPVDDSLFVNATEFKFTRLTDTPFTEKNPVFSHDGKRIAYKTRQGTLWVMDANGQNRRKIADFNDVLWISWSWDSKWLAFSRTALGWREDVYVVKVDSNMAPVNISDHPDDDYKPMWSYDGRRISFASRDEEGNLFIKYVILRKEDADKDAKYFKSLKDSLKSAPEVKIDFDDIGSRIRTVYKFQGGYNYYTSDKWGLNFLIQAEDLNSNDIWMTDLSGHRVKRITKDNVEPKMFFFSGKKIYYLTGEGEIFESDFEGNSKPMPFHLQILVHNGTFRKALFEELWWALNDGFYDPNFHGVNWKEMFKKYLPYARNAYENEDFYQFVRYMLGELNASHLGIWGSDDEFSEKSGVIGIVPVKTRKGIKVLQVIYNSPAYEAGIAKGDVLIKIDGVKLDTIKNYYSALIGKRNKKVKIIRIHEGKTDTLRVKAISYWKLRRMIYKEWVRANKQFVDSVSHHNLAYIHIRAMDMESVKEFKRELYAQRDRKGLVLDIRYNDGGSTHDIILDILRRAHYLYSVKRGEKEKEYRSLFSWDKPVVLIINSNCYSDAEIFPAGFKQLKLGKVVGTPTFGAVIGTDDITLFDGITVFRVPSEGWYRLNGKSLELGPVQPDIYVENPPIYDNTTGDPQLKKAISVLMKEIR